MPTGGLHPQPHVDGGGVPRLERILKALNQARGTAYNTDSDSNVYVENMALARAINETWDVNQRLANIWDPNRLTDMLERWEKILAIPRLPDDADATRRAKVAAHLARFGKAANRARLLELLEAELGAVFVALYYIDTDDAVVQWPANGWTDQFFSSVAHILVKVEKPSGYTEGDFYAAVAKINPLLDGVLPSWVTWDWYRNGSSHTGTWSTDTGAGFWLDDDYNLDNQIFDIDFDPRQLAYGTCRIWFRADMGVTRTLTVIDSWASFDPSGYVVSQSTGANKPTFTASNAAYNNQPTITFGANDYFVGGLLATPITQPCTWYVVGNGNAAASPTDAHVAVDGITAGSSHTISKAEDADNSVAVVNAGSNVWNFTTGADWYAKRIVCAVVNGASSSLYVSSTTATATGNAGSESVTGLTIGYDAAQSGFEAWYGEIAEIICFAGAHDATQREAVINALAARYSVTLL